MRVLPLLALAAAPASVAAWGAAGHEIVATIAQIYLHPSALSSVCAILGQRFEECQLSRVATWADRVRGLPQFRWSGALHYVNPLGDHPAERCTFGEEGWVGREGGNVLAAVRNVTDWLVEGQEGADEALRFLVHFLGDLHMPLHLTGRDKGGNGVKVHFGTRSTNLHSVWDNMLVAKAIRETPNNYTRPLNSRRVERALRGAIYDPYVRQIVWEGLLGAWRDDLPLWASCPEVTDPEPEQRLSLLDRVQVVLGVKKPKAQPSDTDDDFVCPYAWAAEIHPLNCAVIWPSQLNLTSAAAQPREPLLELDEPWYSGRIKEERIVERLLAQAGIRLAAVLNDIYADEVPDVRVPRLLV
ncbi:phospholipase C/P1 nuclease [Auricularia subglabra TFB-10046 SS5]|nr:phospholipase C/P1 nuclease [Auricularia subglabra TFB-10046 SS5]